MTMENQFNIAKIRPLGRPGDLIVDCDGVLLDWVGGFADFIYSTTGRKLDPNGPKNFMLKDWLEVETDAEAFALVTEFNSGQCKLFECLPALSGAKEALDYAIEAGRQIHVITACSKEEHTMEMRRKNLLDAFGDIFKTIICTDLTECKSLYLSKFAPGTWVEDKFENAIKGTKHGHRSFLLRCSHNRSIEERGENHSFQWVDGWTDIIPHI
jgi:hypothetical protein